jgi:sugar (pentulose or hexulose) kinase
MTAQFRGVHPTAYIAGLDFSTGAVKGILFDQFGNVAAEYRLPTDLWTEGGVSELNLMQLEGQARAVIRGLAGRVDPGGLIEWGLGAIGISATHHTAGRIDLAGNQIRRAICWNDQTLAKYHAEGLARLGGQDRAKALTGGPWAVRYTLSHLVKDEHTLNPADWQRPQNILPHGPLAAGYLTGRFESISLSSAASTGMLDLRSGVWCRDMLDALADPAHRKQIEDSLPDLIDMNTPIGPLADHVALDAGMPDGCRPLVFPTLDDQAAGLVGGGAVDAGQVAVILGNSAVVNSSSATLPQSGTLDAMRLNWGPYLWMRCYSNGAQFLDKVVGPNPDWPALERAARAVPPGANGTEVLPFVLAEPSIGVLAPRFEWIPDQPADAGVRVRAAFEALAYLIALAVQEHEAAGQEITRVTVSGGIARSELMGEILASVLNRPLERLVSTEGPALGAAVAALAGLETHLRRQKGIPEPYTVADAVAAMVNFREPVSPRPEWMPAYQEGLRRFAARVSG